MVEVIIVEDEVMVALDLEIMLIGFGYPVLNGFNSGEKLLQHLKFHRVRDGTLILLDVGLSSALSGIDVAGKILLEYGEKYRIIFVTGKTLSEMESWLGVGFVSRYGYVKKPVMGQELRDEIDRVVMM